MAPTHRIRPYKDFLTPALHRRFAMATATLFGLCYVEAVFIGEWNSFIWSWFPFGRAGIRTGLLFIPAFMIFILRVAQLHVGLRTSYSGYETFRRYAFNFHVIQTVGWYFFSAYMFSEIYIWSVPRDADLNRIKVIPKTDRTALNEKPIYLNSYFFALAIFQAACHLYYDYDKIEMPTIKTKPAASSDQISHLVVPPAAQLKGRSLELVTKSLTRVLYVAIPFPILYSIDLKIYPFSIRRFAWSFTRSWAKIFWTLPKSNSLPSTRPFHWSALVRTVTAGFMLVMLWEVGNAAFSAYVAQEPLKNERPITYESRDPNGSLLTGLKGKKLQTRAFAFWELVYISQRFQGRRKVIFEDIDRKGGSAWSQILAVCLEVINGIEQRINEYEIPSVTPAPATALAPPAEPLPRLTQPLKDGLKESGDLFNSPAPAASRGPRAIEAVGSFAKSHGQSPAGNLSPKARELLSKAESAVLTSEQRKAVASQGFVGLFKEWITLFLQTSMGKPFRQEYQRKMAAVVLGSPYGDAGIIVDAIDSLTRLAVHSLTEDRYGNVQRDVKLIIQTLTRTVNKLEVFKTGLGIHWTDIEAKKDSPEVETILAALKGGLSELVNAFDDYSDDLRLSQSEMRMAREAAATAIVPEMQEQNR